MNRVNKEMKITKFAELEDIINELNQQHNSTLKLPKINEHIPEAANMLAHNLPDLSHIIRRKL